MPYIEHEFELDDAALEWLRVRIETRSGDGAGFTVQYATTLDGKRVPVTRYDTAHGRPHQDFLDRQGNVIKKRWLEGNPTFEQALEIGRRDLVDNWSRYRAAFSGEVA